MTSNAGHNTHGSLEEINGQWYVFYHRPPRGFGFARQAVVAPVIIDWDEKSVAQGGSVRIRAFDPYGENKMVTVKDSQGKEYKGAEVTSEGFHIFGLDPYQYYSAGYAAYLSDISTMQDSWDIWDNHMPVTNLQNGNITGFKYFGFGGLKKDQFGLKAFQGTKEGNHTMFNLFLTPKSKKSFKVNVWLDGPYDNAVWNGKKIGEIVVPAQSKFETTQFKIDVSKFVDHLDKKHAIYLVAEGEDHEILYDLIGLGFSSKKHKIDRPIVPQVRIAVNGKALEIPAVPVRSTNANGIVDYDQYEIKSKISSQASTAPVVTASADHPDVKVTITQADSASGTSSVVFNYKGVSKIYKVIFTSE
ncbi:GH43D19 (fragment) [Sphingobacterium sp. PM2-P1-29]